MKKSKSKGSSTIYYIIVCLITLMFIFSPLLIRIPFIYRIVREYLSIFTNDGYRSTYINAMGSILGTFLAIAGAIWTQKISENKKRVDSIRKNALAIYYDYKFALDIVLEIMSTMAPQVRCNTMSDDPERINTFRKLRKTRRIYVDSRWKDLVMSLCEELSLDDIRKAYEIYNNLSMLSVLFNTSIYETSCKEERDAYAIMHRLIQLEIPLTNNLPINVTVKDSVSVLQKRIADIAGIDS